MYMYVRPVDLDAEKPYGEMRTEVANLASPLPYRFSLFSRREKLWCVC